MENIICKKAWETGEERKTSQYWVKSKELGIAMEWWGGGGEGLNESKV